MAKTHVEKVIELTQDGFWHCQTEFREFSWSPHKRRAEARERGYDFDERPCKHGIKGSKDYRLINAPKRHGFRIIEIPGKGAVAVQS